MKNLTMIVVALMAAVAFAQDELIERLKQDETLSVEVNDGNVTLAAKTPVMVFCGEYGEAGVYDPTTVTTNLVHAYEVTTTTWEPCACPDGIIGCCVLHTRKVERKQYIPIRRVEKWEIDDHTYVLTHMNGECVWTHAADCKCKKKEDADVPAPNP